MRIRSPKLRVARSRCRFAALKHRPRNFDSSSYSPPGGDIPTDVPKMAVPRYRAGAVLPREVRECQVRFTEAGQFCAASDTRLLQKGAVELSGQAPEGTDVTCTNRILRLEILSPLRGR